MAVVKCDRCGDAISEFASYQAVTGWEKKRRQGGTNHIVLRRTEQRFLCNICVDRLLHGRDEALF